ncbi:hypothetical protein ACFQU7_22650 [Pseudoroseomonas wenyumeiae]
MSGVNSLRPPSAPRPRQRLHAFNALLLACAGLPLLLAAGEAFQDRRQVLSEAGRNIVVMLDTIHGQAEKVFQFQALALGAAEDRLRGLSNADIRMDAPAHHRFLRRLKLYANEQIGVAIFDDDGRVLVDSERFELMERVNVSRRDYFLWHRDNRGDDPFVSGPVRSQTSDEVVFLITRRRSAEDGSFLGVAAVIVEQRSLLSYWDQAVPDQRGLVSLSLDNGTLLARRPTVALESSLRMLPQGPLSRAASADAERQVVRGVSRSTRWSAWRPSAVWPATLSGLPMAPRWTCCWPLAAPRHGLWLLRGADLHRSLLAGAAGMAPHAAVERPQCHPREPREGADSGNRIRRGTPPPARAGGRSPRQERPGGGAGDAATDTEE